MSTPKNSFQSLSSLQLDSRSLGYFSLNRFAKQEGVNLERLPYSIKILLENVLRNEGGPSGAVDADDVRELGSWTPERAGKQEFAFHPSRVVLQDFTGVPAVVDFAALRDAMAEMGGDPSAINPLFPSELVIDHSVQVDAYGSAQAMGINQRLEYQRNRERYQLLRWAQGAFDNFQVVPPGTGIVHQVNLEYLARVVMEHEGMLYPDTLVGTDSHTTMINGLGVLGWGVGGIEAEAAMLGQPIHLLVPGVVGVHLTGQLPPGATATDLVLTITELLRRHGVVGKFVEFFGTGLSALPLADRATISNMSPEFGSTCAIFPVDSVTLDYLRFTGRSDSQLRAVESYCKEQGLWRDGGSKEAVYSERLELDLASIEPSIAGPKRPQDRVALRDSATAWKTAREALSSRKEPKSVSTEFEGQRFELKEGAVVIAAITSCTNTSNPSVMLAAGLLARNARAKGLAVQPWVKTSLAPGSRVVTEYLSASGLLEELEGLSFHVVGYGCTTCIGNSGPLPDPIAKSVEEGQLVVCSVLSGNRNFEGRINPHVRANYLASPPLVVAYALAGRLDIDFEQDPLGVDDQGKPVFLRDIWPADTEVQKATSQSLSPQMFREKYSDVFQGDDTWRKLDVPEGSRFDWKDDSTYVRRPSFFMNLPKEPPPLEDVVGARVLLLLGDSVTTDHISPAGSIAKNSEAAQYLISKGVDPKDFNSYGSRRGNHEVMVRGTFANVRLRNQLAPGTEGGFTQLLPEGEVTSVYAAAQAYAQRKVPLIVIAGTEYGSGSSRDWAAKGTVMLGIRAVIARSYERIHRSNLVGMGVLPLQFLEGESRESLQLSGHEELTIEGISQGLQPSAELTVRVQGNPSLDSFRVLCRIDTGVELEYYRHGGILQYVLRQLLRAG